MIWFRKAFARSVLRAVAYVDSARVSEPQGLQFNPGEAAPLHCTSMTGIAQTSKNDIVRLFCPTCRARLRQGSAGSDGARRGVARRAIIKL